MIEWAKEGRRELWHRQLRVSLVILSAGVPAVVVGFLLIPVIYPFLYGPEFQAAAIPCGILIAAKLAVLLNGIYGWGSGVGRAGLYHVNDHGVAAVVSLSLNFVLIPRFGMLERRP